MNKTETMTPVVGMGATEYVGSDRYPNTIVKVITPKKIIVQRDNFTRTDKNGLSESQEYVYSRNGEAYFVTVSLRKNGRWVVEGQKAKGGIGFEIGYRRAYLDPSF